MMIRMTRLFGVINTIMLMLAWLTQHTILLFIIVIVGEVVIFAVIKIDEKKHITSYWIESTVAFAYYWSTTILYGLLFSILVNIATNSMMIILLVGLAGIIAGVFYLEHKEKEMGETVFIAFSPKDVPFPDENNNLIVILPGKYMIIKRRGVGAVIIIASMRDRKTMKMEMNAKSREEYYTIIQNPNAYSLL